MILSSALLADIPSLHHAFATRLGGVSRGIYESLNTGWGSGDDLAAVAENRARIAAHFGVLPSHLLSCYQIHSPDVITVTDIFSPVERPRADAMVTHIPGLALGILTADCVPVLLCDPVAKVIGAAHAGWRGALGGVLQNTVSAMKNLGAHPSRIVAVLGPAIAAENYEVGPDFPAPFLALDQNHKVFFTPAEKKDHFFFDLPAFVMQVLRQEGICSIAPSLANTYADPTRFYSFRRATHEGVGKTGSLMSAIVLR
jgi:polyphenol oxidase